MALAAPAAVGRARLMKLRFQAHSESYPWAAKIAPQPPHRVLCCQREGPAKVTSLCLS